MYMAHDSRVSVYEHGDHICKDDDGDISGSGGDDVGVGNGTH